MEWFWKVPSPKLVYITMSLLLYVCVIGTVAYLYDAIVYESFEALIITNIFAVAGLILAVITLGYWSIINTILDKEKGLPKGAE